MSADIIDLRARMRANGESSDERWVRDRVGHKLARCRLTTVQVANGIAEAKRLLRIGWPKENAASEAVTRALSNARPTPPTPPFPPQAA
jgi:hypothetical protein